MRIDAINGDTIKQYFDLLKDVITEHNLKYFPAQIYSMDDGGVPLAPGGHNVVAKKKVYSQSTSQKGQVTEVACRSAVGQIIPPMVKLCHAWTANEITGSSYGLSDSGWITTTLFESWLADHFLKYAVI